MAGIYIHVPFCHSKCPYCDFYSMPGRGDLYEAFVESLIAEWQLRSDELQGPFTTLYFGGGTPSILPVGMMASVVDALPVDDVEEFTVEVNPEDVTPQLVASLRAIGVNRISMGVQSLSDSLLTMLRRGHSAAGALRAMDLLRSGGISNISLDLMYGLPGQTMEQWTDTLRQMMDFRPEHLSAYILSYEPGTRFTAMLSRGKLPEQDEMLVTEMYGALCDAASGHGYTHYEISNFALPGRESRHNSSYWDFTPYIGLGPGAHSFDGAAIRRANPPSLRDYIQGISSGHAVAEIEEETADSLFNDRVITSLRTARGLLIDGAERDRMLAAAAPFIADGRMSLTSDGRLVISESAWLTADHIMSEFIKV